MAENGANALGKWYKCRNLFEIDIKMEKSCMIAQMCNSKMNKGAFKTCNIPTAYEVVSLPFWTRLRVWLEP